MQDHIANIPRRAGRGLSGGGAPWLLGRRGKGGIERSPAEGTPAARGEEKIWDQAHI